LAAASAGAQPSRRVIPEEENMSRFQHQPSSEGDGRTLLRRLRLAAILAAFWLVGAFSWGQDAEVIRNVALHASPSSADATVEHLHPPAIVTVLDPAPSNGYLHVRSAAGNEGWAYAKNLHIAAEEGPSTGSGGHTALLYDQIDLSWPKPEPVVSTFSQGSDICGPDGEGGDSDTNHRKNRTDEPPAYYSVSFAAVADLSFPKGAPRSREQWSSSQLNEIKPYEGVPISITAYLVDEVKQEKAETTNCGLTEPEEVDWHMYLTQDFVADDGKKHKGEAVVVETTPRVRKNHPNWHLDVLRRWVNKDQPVRISGWLLLDPEHQGDIAKGYRSTIWEIHPITHIEVTHTEHPTQGDWKDLEDEQ
jgi:hypothetical protein